MELLQIYADISERPLCLGPSEIHVNENMDGIAKSKQYRRIQNCKKKKKNPVLYKKKEKKDVLFSRLWGWRRSVCPGWGPGVRGALGPRPLEVGVQEWGLLLPEVHYCKEHYSERVLHMHFHPSQPR